MFARASCMKGRSGEWPASFSAKYALIEAFTSLGPP
jgi:hypothetical protein